MTAMELVEPGSAIWRPARLVRSFWQSQSTAMALLGFTKLIFPGRPSQAVTFVPLLNDLSLTNAADRRRIAIPMRLLSSRRHSARVAKLADALSEDSDILYIQSRDFSSISRSLGLLNGRKVIFTFSDAFFFGSESGCHSENPQICDAAAPAISDDIRKAFNRFDLIVCGSSEQMRQICSLGLATPSKCVVLLDPIDTETYAYQRGIRAPIGNGPLRVAWEGFVDNIPSLNALSSALTKASAARRIELVVLCSRSRRTPYRGTVDNEELAKLLLPGCNVRFVEWTPQNASREMSLAHIGVNPVLPDRFNWSKPANKSAILNWFGLPVIASANPSNQEWIENGRTGFSAATPEEWFDAFVSINDMALKKMSVASENKAKQLMKNYRSNFLASLQRVTDVRIK